MYYNKNLKNILYIIKFLKKTFKKIKKKIKKKNKKKKKKTNVHCLTSNKISKLNNYTKILGHSTLITNAN